MADGLPPGWPEANGELRLRRELPGAALVAIVWPQAEQAGWLFRVFLSLPAGEALPGYAVLTLGTERGYAAGREETLRAAEAVVELIAGWLAPRAEE